MVQTTISVIYTYVGGQIRIIEIDENHSIGSLDIQQMYPIIPVTYNATIKGLADKTCKDRTEWSSKQIVHLLGLRKYL